MGDQMFKRAILTILAAAFFLLGLIGLLIPVLPGFLFLILAVVCLTAPMDGRHTPSPYPSGHGWCSIWRESRSLPLYRRAQLAFWLSAAAMVDAIRRGPSTQSAGKPG